MQPRALGKLGTPLSPMGMGCWAIGGPLYRDGQAAGWGLVAEETAIATIHASLDHGITFFDTADQYGCGQSEVLLGKALKGRRDQVVIATKFGHAFDEATKEETGKDASPEYIRHACEQSLRRLQTDHIDLYQFHLGQFPAEEAEPVRETLEDLVSAGKIGGYGWSTDFPDKARALGEGKHAGAVQHHFNIFEGNAELLDLCEELDLASINRAPLAMGMLTGKFAAEAPFPDWDVRSAWNAHPGHMARRIEDLAAVREIITQGGRTPAQGALAWLWARSDRTIPIPGAKTPEQAIENASAMAFGPLSPTQMEEVEDIRRKRSEA